MQLTAIMRREGPVYTSLCPELDVASQGESLEEAKANLQEAVELFLEVASRKEIEARFQQSAFISAFEVTIG
jgi:predicted RNase H-like HicB family nuclease